ncbi:MAG: cation:proton antiporter [Cyanobacteria bacterium P01_H01_bin.74]
MSAAASVSAAGSGSLDVSILYTMVLVFVTGAVMSFFLSRIKLPTFLGFILAGIVLGPAGASIISPDQMHVLSQIGIIFLLFIVGLELSIDKLKSLRFQAPMAGVLQIVITSIVLTVFLKYGLQLPWQLAIIIGAVLSLSSTAVVLKGLEEHRIIDSVHGRVVLGMLIIQDLAIIPLMAILPFLLQPVTPAALVGGLGFVILKTIIVGILAVFIGLKLVPKVLDHLILSNQKELFTLAIACVGLGMALITHEMGLSYEAGAFIAGISLNRSLFCKQLIIDSKSFRDVFITFFFVSMGLVFNPSVLMAAPLDVLLVTAGIIAVKGLCAYLAVRFVSLPHKTGLWSAICLFQVGEFSFVLLAKTLQAVQQVSVWRNALNYWSPIFIDAIIITMFLTPIVIGYFNQWFSAREKAKSNEAYNESIAKNLPVEKKTIVIIAGYGPVAQILGEMLEQMQVNYCVVEINPKTVKALDSKGITCLYGDITRQEILLSAGVKDSQILVLTFPDVKTAELSINQAKNINPNLLCMARARFRNDIEPLYKVGADTVIYDEMETGIRFVIDTLDYLKYPLIKTEHLTSQLRQETQLSPDFDRATTTLSASNSPFGRFNFFPGSKIEWIAIPPNSALSGKTMQTLNVLQETGVSVVAVVDGVTRQHSSVDPKLILKPNDILIAIGNIEQLNALENLLNTSV